MLHTGTRIQAIVGVTLRARMSATLQDCRSVSNHFLPWIHTVQVSLNAWSFLDAQPTEPGHQKDPSSRANPRLAGQLPWPTRKM
eukprot:1146429-Pelagomonas_calceolata.AAC.1